MDGLSTAATVIQLAQVAAQAVIALSQYIVAVKGAESSRTKLVDQIALISAAGKAVESVVQNYPPKPSLRSGSGVMVARLGARKNWKTELFVRKQRGAGPPADVGTLSNLIKRAAGLYKRPMIVIDALDAVQIAS